MTTVADILAARPSLRDRAREAAKFAAEVEHARRRDEEADLIRESCVWLTNIAQCTPAEIEDIEFTAESFSTDGGQRMVLFTLDRINFKARYEIKTVMTKTGGSEFTSERITDRQIRFDVQKLNGSWVQIRSLADVGKEVAS